MQTIDKNLPPFFDDSNSIWALRVTRLPPNNDKYGSKALNHGPAVDRNRSTYKIIRIMNLTHAQFDAALIVHSHEKCETCNFRLNFRVLAHLPASNYRAFADSHSTFVLWLNPTQRQFPASIIRERIKTSSVPSISAPLTWQSLNHVVVRVTCRNNTYMRKRRWWQQHRGTVPMMMPVLIPGH